MSKTYTEGPWETFQSKYGDGSPATVLRSKKTGACVGWPEGPTDSEREGNAALQSLAPQMLDVCEYMLAHAFERKWDGDERAYNMLAAIIRLAPKRQAALQENKP